MNPITPAYVTFEQAKWLKDIGFDVPCISLFNYEGIEQIWKDKKLRSNKKEVSDYIRPEQWQVIEWLRVNHGIWVYATPRYSSWIFGVKNLNNWNEHNLVDVDFWNTNEYLISRGVPTIMISPQEAYSAAFDYIITNIFIDSCL
jgi:hypothetical protein